MRTKLGPALIAVIAILLAGVLFLSTPMWKQRADAMKAAEKAKAKAESNCPCTCPVN